MNKSRRAKGFTLVEIALALLVLGLISVGLLYAFGQQFKNTKYKESAASLLYSKKALLNFVELNGYLPCPDTNGDGVEDRNGLACSANAGTLPYKDLGLAVGQVRDSWGNDIHYYTVANVTNAAQICSTSPTRYSANYFCKVNAPVFDSKTPPTASDSDANNLDIYDAAAGGNAIVTQMSVILVASNSNGGAGCATSLAADEQENCDGDQVFVQHDRTDSPFFDDQLITISGYEIKRPQLFTASNLSSPPVFLSKFKDQHTKLYNMLSQYNVGGGSSSSGTNWLSRLVDEDQRLFKSEKLMLYDNACAVEPDLFNNPDNYTLLPSVASAITLNTTAVKANLKVSGGVTPDGIITGADEDNTVFISQDMNGKIQLGNGKNTIVIAGKSAGDIVSGDLNDTVRICQGAQQTSIQTGGAGISPVQLNFDYEHNGSSMGGMKWFYHHVAKSVNINGSLHDVDAVVEIVNYSPNFGGMCGYNWWFGYYPASGDFCISHIDYEAPGVGKKDAIQPVYWTRTGIPASTDMWIDIRVTFYDHKTGNTLLLPAFMATTLDMDGWDDRNNPSWDIPKQYEYGFFFDTTNFTLEDNSELRPYVKKDQAGPYNLSDYIDGNTVKVIASDPKDVDIPVDSNGVPNYPWTMVTTSFYDRNSFKYRIGLDVEANFPLNARVGRINSTWFGTPKYNNAQTVVVGGTLNLGQGNDEILIGGNIDRDTYLGDGDNYAYFFSNSYQKVIGSDGDDNVTSLGDLGWPAPQPNSLGWDLKGGNNSARVKGSCFAPIAVGSGDDLFIVAANTERECAINTQAGNDLILVDGMLKTALDAGTGDDFAVIHATDPSASMSLGDGNDTLVVETLLWSNIDAGAGDDTIVLQAGADDSVGFVKGGPGNDVLEVNYTQSQWDASALKNKISGIETVKLLDGQISIP